MCRSITHSHYRPSVGEPVRPGAGIPEDTKLVLLIGANGSGKSSVFDGFEFVSRGSKRGNYRPQDLYYRKSEVGVDKALREIFIASQGNDATTVRHELIDPLNDALRRVFGADDSIVPQLVNWVSAEVGKGAQQWVAEMQKNRNQLLGKSRPTGDRTRPNSQNSTGNSNFKTHIERCIGKQLIGT